MSQHNGAFYDQDVERAILGALILQRKPALKLLSSLQPDDFYDLKHQEIYKAIKQCHETDEVSVENVLWWIKKKNKKLDDLEIKSIVHQTTEHSGHYGPGKYENIIKDYSARRLLKQAVQSLDSNVYDLSKDTNDIISHFRELADTSKEKISKGEPDITTLVENVEDEYRRIKNGEIVAIPTGHKWVDSILKNGGVRRGHYTVIGGRTSSGKTALAVNMAIHQAVKEKMRVLFFTAEMTQAEVVERAIKHMAGIDDMFWIKGGSQTDYKRYEKSKKLLQEADLQITKQHAHEISDILSHTETENRLKPVDVVVVDYINRIHASERGRSGRQEEVSYISGKLKDMAQRNDLTVIALAQLNRESEKSGNTVREARITDLRDSGSIEQDADSIILITREDAVGQKASDIEPETEPDVLRIMSIAKQRSGPTGRNPYWNFNRPTLSWWNYNENDDTEKTETSNAANTNSMWDIGDDVTKDDTPF